MINSDNGFDKNFKKIYETLFSIIFRVAFRITGDVHRAEDICHEAFIQYYTKGRALPDTNQIKYWLIRVVKNLSFNSEKKKDREKKAIAKLDKTMPKAAESCEKDYIKAETGIAVQKALNELPHNLKTVIILKEYEGLTYKEIGSIIGITEANVKVRVFRGRQKLEKLIKEWNFDVS